MLRRSQLYVPGNNERMITKAPTLGADSVILDLEDSVPADRKGEARKLVAKLSERLEWRNHELCVRINPQGSGQFASDVTAVRDCSRVDCVVVPKAEGSCTAIHSRTKKGLIPIIETATGLMHIRDVVSSRGIVAVSYGAADYASSVGGSVSAYLGNATIKTMMVAAAADAGVDAVDCVFFDLRDAKAFRREARFARSLGYTGKQVIHPNQIKLANQIFTPSKDEIEWAESVLREMGKAEVRARGATRVGGSLVDAVHYRLAKGIIEGARRSMT